MTYPFAVMLPHSGIADAAEWQVRHQRLNRAIVHVGISRLGRIEDALGNNQPDAQRIEPHEYFDLVGP